MSDTARSHRLALLIPDDVMPRLFLQGSVIQIHAGIPRGAHLVGAYYDYLKRFWALVYEHPSFPLVPFGVEAPGRVVRFELLEEGADEATTARAGQNQ